MKNFKNGVADALLYGNMTNKYGDGYKLYTSTSAYPNFDRTNPMRNTRTLSSDPNKRKQQILEATTGDVSQGFEWSTPETDWSSAPESNVPFIGPQPPINN